MECYSAFLMTVITYLYYYVLILCFNIERSILSPYFQVPRPHHNHFQKLIIRTIRGLFLLSNLMVRFAFASVCEYVEMRKD